MYDKTYQPPNRADESDGSDDSGDEDFSLEDDGFEEIKDTVSSSSLCQSVAPIKSYYSKRKRRLVFADNAGNLATATGKNSKAAKSVSKGFARVLD